MVLARDIYKDFYDTGPTLEEKIFLVARRACFVFAGCALVLGVLDIAGIRSVDGAVEFASSARASFSNFGDSVRTGVSSIAINPSLDSVRVAIPKSASKAPSKSSPSVVEELAAVRKQDAIALAMTSPQLTTREEKSRKAAPSPVVVASALPDAPVTLRPTSMKAQPFPTIPEIAAKSETSVPTNPPVQMASLPQEPALQAPAPALAPLPPQAPISIPLSQVPLPMAKPPLSPAARLNLHGKEYDRAERCLANAVYFEARSEPIRGQMAVAQVVMNRVFSGFYPDDVCSVVYQNAHRKLACQFTFACDGKSKAITERGAWARANRIARQTLDGQIYVPEVAKSTHYHAAYVHPNWVREMKRLVRFGIHSFYRPYAWGNGADEPSWGSAASTSHKKTAAR